MTEPPPLPKKKTANTGRIIYVRLAMASWLLPISSYVSQIVVGKLPLPASILMGLAGLQLFLLVAGVVCGIIALTGVKKHRKQGIFVPALMGIGISVATVVLITLLLPALLKAKQRAQIQQKKLELKSGHEDKFAEPSEAKP